MALIGTISGSNGTSTTAISGSLIIADAPPSTFPKLQGDVKFLVSGSKNATRTDNPEFLFNIDVFHSGAIGSDQFMQFKPVNLLQIPTNTTASYIYTSGSTNDLYFTQYNGPYTNTTRLRWLEGMLTTGLLHGGVLSTATGSTTFSITSGSGIILSYNATLTTDPYPTINFVQWPAYVSQSLTYVTSSLITYIGINSTGGIIQQTSPFTLTTDSDYITIGRVLHQSGSVTNGVSTQPIVSYGTNHWQDDFTRAFGPLKVSGHILAASGSTLGITKTAGDSYVIGKNYTNNPNNPNNITSANDTAVTVSKIYRAYVSGSTLRLDTGVNNAGYTTINPAQYNNNGTLASVGANNASIQRVYWYPNTVSRAFTVYYGSAVYADPPGGTTALDVAQQYIASENFVEGENTAGAAILVGYILALGNATDLSNTAQARFIQAGVSRGAGAGGGGGVAVGATTPGGLDTYVQFNDGGSTFGGAAGLTYNKTTDTLTVAGDIAINGGDITTTSATFNLVTGSATTVNFAQSATTLSVGKSAGSTNIAGGLTGSFVFIGENLTIGGASQADILTTKTTANLYNTVATTVNIAGAATSVNIGSSGGSTTISGNVTGSNIRLAGDLAVNGGDITTTASSFNLITGSATSVNFASSATSILIGSNVGSATIYPTLTGANGVVVQGPTSSDIVAGNATGNIFNTVASTINLGGAATSITMGSGSSNSVMTINGVVTASSGKIALTNAGGSLLSFPLGAGALGAPTFSNSTVGTKIILYPNVSVTSTDFAIGMENFGLWQSLPTATQAYRFKWYGGTTEIASLRGDGLFTVTGSIATSTGNIIGAPGSGANVMTLISSGNVVVKLDIDNNAIGHQFQVQDYQGINQFTVGEDGNAWLSGSLVVTGSVNVVSGNLITNSLTANVFETVATTVNIGGNANTFSMGKSGQTVVSRGALRVDDNVIKGSGGATVLTLGNPAGLNGSLQVSNNLAVGGTDLTTTQTTFNLINTTATAINFGGAATSISHGSSTTTSSFTGDIAVAGKSTLATVVERLINNNGSTGVTAFDLTAQGIFYVNGAAGDITANFTNVPTNNSRVITPTIILSQSATARVISACQIDGASQTINWANNVTPTGTANKQDVYGFSLIRSGSAWKVLGQLSTYG